MAPTTICDGSSFSNLMSFTKVCTGVSRPEHVSFEAHSVSVSVGGDPVASAGGSRGGTKGELGFEPVGSLQRWPN